MGKKIRVTLISNTPNRTPMDPASPAPLYPVPMTSADRRAEHRILRRGLRRLIAARGNTIGSGSPVAIEVEEYEFVLGDCSIVAISIAAETYGRRVPLGCAFRTMSGEAREILREWSE